MSQRNQGDKLCISCFDRRERNASKNEKEHALTGNIGKIFLFSMISPVLLLAKAKNAHSYPDGYIYHIYINGAHERWSKYTNVVDPKKCDKCNGCIRDYYQLESNEFSLFNFL